MKTQTDKPKFPLGQLLATPGALKAMENAGQSPGELLIRHVTGDWGLVCKADAEANEQAIKERTRLLSSYKLATGIVIWIITEASRAATTLLLPSEY